MKNTLLVSAALLLAACGGSGSNPDGGTNNNNTSHGAGTCASPIDLAGAGTAQNGGLVYHGSTASATNTLHPRGGCAAMDDNEVVMRYTVPSNVTALKVSTDGTMFNTVLYARDTCEQTADGMELSCNDDNYDHAPASTIYLTAVTAGQSLFFVVDGTPAGGADVPAHGDFTLTVTPVTLGAVGSPCRPMEEGSTAPRCDANTLCSAYGGAADGTPLCVPGVANNAACDTRGFSNTCSDAMATCAMDPSPADGAMVSAVCALPGTHVGAPCRESEPRCDAGAVCGTGDTPMCVRVLTATEPCDTTGATNSCPNGMTCRAAAGAMPGEAGACAM